MASIELSRVATEVNAAVSGLQSALDRAERALAYFDAHDLGAELTGLAAGAVITGDVNKERAAAAGTLAANLIYYIRGVQAGAGQTLLGAAPLAPADLKALSDKLAI